MKLQVFVLLGLLCSTAICAITNTETAVLDSITYGLGKEGNDCGVTRNSGNTLQQSKKWTTTLANSGDCTPQGIFVIGSNVWVVLQTNANADILNVGNANNGNLNTYNIRTDNADLTGAKVLIARIVTTNDGDFGEFLYGTQFGSKNAGGTWGTFTISDVTTCSTTIQIQGDTQSDLFFVVNNSGTNSDISGDDVFVAFSTGDQTWVARTDDNKPCSGLILSMAGALVSLVAMLF